MDGMPITKWVNHYRSTELDRIRLFIEACEAVSFAHQNLIVHRDITPSNVLVDKSARVKVIDFGIAKPFASDDPQYAAEHSIESLSYTPGFAAPERVSGHAVTTLADTGSGIRTKNSHA